MKIISRPFDENKGDYKKLWHFLIKYKAVKGDSQWSIGRLSDWKYGLWHEKKQMPSFLSDNCQLYTTAFDDLVGFAIAEEGDSLFHLFAYPEYEQYLAPGMLDYVESNWTKKDGLRTEISEQDTCLDQLLLKRGYSKKASSRTSFFDLSDFNREAILPNGFKVINYKEAPDPDGKMKLYMDGFDGRQDEPTSWDRTIHAYNRESPAYNPRFDYSVINEDGLQVSGCVCFVDFENSYAEIEKVCTREAYRKKGLAFGVIQHAMEELKGFGIKTASITGYSDAAKNTYKKGNPVEIITNYEYHL